jgi:hypothetical protein
MTVRQTFTAPLAGALQSAFAGGGVFALFREGGIAGERPPATRYADAAVFEHAPRYHGGGFAGSGLLPDEVPIIARRGERWWCRPSASCAREVGTRAAADHGGGQRHRRGCELISCEPGSDRGRHGARDRSGEPEPLNARGS